MKKVIQNKDKLVNAVFSEVYKKYDLMNDIMSFGIHRLWKAKFIDLLNPQPETSLIDVASGTGDIAKLYLERTNSNGKITCVEPNIEMLNKGKKKFKKFNNINWINAKAEEISEAECSFDYYTISFGIRNVSDINTTLKKAFKVLKPGGRFMCLEFSKIDNEILNYIYKQYSSFIPYIGKVVVGSSEPYEYLIDSIDKFYDQKQLAKMLIKTGFSNVEFRNLSNGIAAIHSGWKI